MAASWTQVTDVHKLQQQGIKMTELYWSERDERKRLEMLVQELRKQLNESFYVVENVETRKHQVQDVLDVTFKNYANLAETVVKLSSKPDNTPLNNEMAQVISIIDESVDKQSKDVEQLKQHHAKIVAKLDSQRRTSNKVWQYENCGLQIKLEKEKKVKELTVSKYNDLIDTVLNLATKENGTSLNGEMEQVVQVMNESKRSYGIDMARVEIHYLDRLSEMYDKCKKK